MFCHFCGKNISFSQWYDLEYGHPMCGQCYNNKDKPFISKEKFEPITSRFEILDL